jgi:hypothetical protein
MSGKNSRSLAAIPNDARPAPVRVNVSRTVLGLPHSRQVQSLMVRALGAFPLGTNPVPPRFLRTGFVLILYNLAHNG